MMFTFFNVASISDCVLKIYEIGFMVMDLVLRMQKVILSSAYVAVFPLGNIGFRRGAKKKKRLTLVCQHQ